MKAIAKKYGKSVYSTGYRPHFAYKALVTFLELNEMECYSHGKSKNTNSFYIVAANKDDSMTIEIRISDHTKFQESDERGSYVHIYDSGNSLDINVICKDGFLKAKEEIQNFVN